MTTGGHVRLRAQRIISLWLRSTEREGQTTHLDIARAAGVRDDRRLEASENLMKKTDSIRTLLCHAVPKSECVSHFGVRYEGKLAHSISHRRISVLLPSSLRHARLELFDCFVDGLLAFRLGEGLSKSKVINQSRPAGCGRDIDDAGMGGFVKEWKKSLDDIFAAVVVDLEGL